MALQLIHVDAFSDMPFGGNPAAVCVLSEPRSRIWMQRMAFEMNLSETAFVLPEGDAFNLRWFTPRVEVELCGHATLAAAHVLWERGLAKRDKEVHFTTLSGSLYTRFNDGWIEMDFPEERESKVEPPTDLLSVLNVEAKYVGQNRFDYLVEVDSEMTLRAMSPDFGALSHFDTRGVIVTAQSASDKFDFVSRFFAPGLGINEDPVTGSAHCCLGPYWSSKLNKKEMLAYQASSRGGVVQVKMEKDRVILGGQAVTILRAEIAEMAENADDHRERLLTF